MQTLETLKIKSQENLNRLVELGKEQPSEVKTWGVTAGAAVAGGLALTATAQGLLAVFATLASLPVSLTVGAIGGGVLGWLYIDQKKTANKATATAEPATVAAEITMPESVNIPVSNESAVAEKVEAVVISENIMPNRTSEPVLITPEIVTESQISVVAALEPEDTTAAVLAAQPDNLEAINGIGPVFAKRLQATGVHTFAQLAAMSPEQVMGIMATSRGGQLIDATAWIEQARQLAASTNV